MTAALPTPARAATIAGISGFVRAVCGPWTLARESIEQCPIITTVLFSTLFKSGRVQSLQVRVWNRASLDLFQGTVTLLNPQTILCPEQLDPTVCWVMRKMEVGIVRWIMDNERSPSEVDFWAEIQRLFCDLNTRITNPEHRAHPDIREIIVAWGPVDPCYVVRPFGGSSSNSPS